MRVVIALCFLAVFTGGCARTGSNGPAVVLDGMEVVGHWTEDRGVAAFLGVPFAQPPLAERRFLPPEPLERMQSAVDATAFAPACMQTDYMVDWYRELIADFGGDPRGFARPEFDENCLHLNVWTPDSEPDTPLPVMVWIHGGGYRGGWSFEPNYIGDALAARGVVVVSIAYRVDVFGFLAHPAFDVSNPGLLDQVAALQWIRKNIGAFGGNPDNVTVFGESAGGASIGYLLSMPAASGLFRRAIIQSAGYHLRYDDRRADYAANWEQHDWPGRGERSTAELQAIDADTWLAAADSVYPDYRPDATIDGISLPESPASALAGNRFAAVDLMIGSNADEWRMYLDPDSDTAAVDEWLDRNAPEQRAAVYEMLGEDPVRNLDRLITAWTFVCPSLELADAMHRRGANAYVYYFSRVRDSAFARELGAYHGAEIPYVFDKHDDWLPTDSIDRELTDTIMSYWVEFARTGDPNVDGLPDWPPWDGTEVLELGTEAQSTEHPERALCETLRGSKSAGH